MKTLIPNVAEYASNLLPVSLMLRGLKQASSTEPKEEYGAFTEEKFAPHASRVA
ncbi:MAG: hypothetical protein QXJ02_00955 [Candidatus Bathyarchaeia archaeon]